MVYMKIEKSLCFFDSYICTLYKETLYLINIASSTQFVQIIYVYPSAFKVKNINFVNIILSFLLSSCYTYLEV